MRRFAVPALAAVVLVVFGASLGGGFLNWDDVQHFKFNRALVAGDWFYFWRHAYYGFYAPVIYTLWTLLYEVSSSPAIFHALNLILHFTNVMLVFLLAEKILLSWRTAFLAALFFALHPLQVEPVAWISGGRDLLAATEGLTAAYLLMRGNSALATASFALGLLTKPSLAPWPLALLALDGVRPTFPRPTLYGWLSLSVLAGGLTLYSQAPFSDPRLGEIFFFETFGFYFSKLIHPADLSFSYGRGFADIYFIYFALAVLFFAGLSYRYGRTIGYMALAAALMLLPTSGLVPFAGQAQSLVYDRYMYLPLFALSLIFAVVAEKRVMTIALLIPLALTSFERTKDWRSNRALFERALDVNPQNDIALVNLALEEIPNGDLARAEDLLLRAHRLRPKDALPAANLAHVFWLRRNPGAILADLAPLTENPEFLLYNQREREALALLFRMTARARAATLDRSGAASDYASALEYRPNDAELLEEMRRFEAESQ